ncbi:MAG: zinc ribbon domain-containing protein [Halodesulfurarchaeum sp.]
MTSTWFRRRPFIAAILAFIYPGLGHVYLRAWLRALAWFGLAVLTAMLVIPESAITAFRTGGFQGLLQASGSFPMEVTLSLLVVRVLNVVDAYLTGLRQSPGEGIREVEGPTCPECGKELDEDLDFCPWCTARLTDREDEEDEVEPATSR